MILMYMMKPWPELTLKEVLYTQLHKVIKHYGDAQGNILNHKCYESPSRQLVVVNNRLYNMVNVVMPLSQALGVYTCKKLSLILQQAIKIAENDEPSEVGIWVAPEIESPDIVVNHMPHGENAIKNALINVFDELNITNESDNFPAFTKYNLYAGYLWLHQRMKKSCIGIFKVKGPMTASGKSQMVQLKEDFEQHNEYVCDSGIDFFTNVFLWKKKIFFLCKKKKYKNFYQKK